MLRAVASFESMTAKPSSLARRAPKQQRLTLVCRAPEGRSDRVHRQIAISLLAAPWIPPRPSHPSGLVGASRTATWRVAPKTAATQEFCANV
jgi:hypothetical protein